MNYSELLNHFVGGSIFSLAIFFLLICLSVSAWGIGISKVFTFSSLARSNRRFQERCKPFSMKKINELEFRYKKPSLLYHVFRQLANSYRKSLHNPPQSEENLNCKDLNALLEKKLNLIAIRISDNMDSGVSFLATVSSTAPFIGLLGTVLGVTFAFQEIGLQGSTNLAVVAPGISEALIATAFGLFAAIPAGFFYNYSRAQIRKLKSEIYLFGQDLIAFLVYNS